MAQIYLLDSSKSSLGFVDLDDFIKDKGQVTKDKFSRNYINFLNQWLDVHQTCIDISL